MVKELRWSDILELVKQLSKSSTKFFDPYKGTGIEIGGIDIKNLSFNFIETISL